MPFIFSNWYWYVGDQRDQVYSSALATYVPITNADYIAWTTAGNMPTMIPSEEILFTTLARLYPAGTPAGRALTDGLQITSTVVPELNGTYDISVGSQGTITSIAAAINAGLGLPGGGATFIYTDKNGIPHAWPAAQFTLFAKTVMNYVYAVNLASSGAGSIPTQPIAID